MQSDRWKEKEKNSAKLKVCSGNCKIVMTNISCNILNRQCKRRAEQAGYWTLDEKDLTYPW
jgi:hypothetical protein